jgi:electron transfer flavoprotein alpha subunit
MAGVGTMDVWAFLETAEGGRRLHPTACQMATESRRLSTRVGGTPGGILVGAVGDEPLHELQRYGLEKIYRVETGLDFQSLEAYEQAIVSLWQRYQPQLLLWAATSRGCEVAARVAARISAGFLANVVEYEKTRDGAMQVRCTAFDSKVHRVVSLDRTRPWVLTVHLPSLEAVSSSPQDVPLVQEHYAFSPEQFPLRFCGLEHVSLDALDIREATVVIGVGRGAAHEEILAPIHDLGRLLRAPIGGSRVAVEMGLVQPARQIGLSGLSIEPEVYIACGISGATHHVMGTRGVKHIVAINRDRHAPIFQVAEVGIVGDLRQVVPAIIERVKTGGALFSS